MVDTAYAVTGEDTSANIHCSFYNVSNSTGANRRLLQTGNQDVLYYVTVYFVDSDVARAAALAVATAVEQRNLPDLPLAPYGSNNATIGSDCSPYSSNMTECIVQQNMGNCQIGYYSPIECDPGPPTADTCASFNTSSVCHSNNCYWDDDVDGCFDTVGQVSDVFSCSFWTSSSACSGHGCTSYNDGAICVPYVQNNGSSSNVITFREPVTYGAMVVTAQSILATAHISIPIYVNMQAPLRYVFAVGSYSADFPESIVNVLNSACSSLTTPLSNSVPSPISYTGGQNLTQYLISWVNSNNNLAFDGSAEGTALASYFAYARVGSGALFDSVSISDDGYSLVLEYIGNLSTYASACPGVTSSSGFGQTTYYVPVAVAEQEFGGAWGLSSTSYAVQFSTIGSVTVNTGVQFIPSVSLVSATSSQSTCAAGSQLLTLTYSLVYTNVYDTSVLVGPRSVADVYAQADNSGLVDCYGDTAVETTGPTCSGDSCATIIVMQSRCRVISQTGDSFTNCNADTNPADYLADLGNATAQYPTSLNNLHNFFVMPYACNSSGCVLANPNPARPTYVSSIISLDVYPLSFIEAPGFEIDFGLLQTPSTAINTSLNAYTNQFNVSGTLNNVPLTFVLDGPLMDLVSIALQLDNPALRATYTLELIVDDSNITVTPLDFDGNVVPGGLVLTAENLRPYFQYAPRLDRCEGCPLIPVCQGVLGCDGFSVSMIDIVSLSPAQGYEIIVNYAVVLPSGSSSTGRRLLATVSGNSAYSWQGIEISTSWYTNRSPGGLSSSTGADTSLGSSSSKSTLAEGAIIAIVVVVVIVLIVLTVVLVWYFRCRSSSVGAPRYNTPSSSHRARQLCFY